MNSPARAAIWIKTIVVIAGYVLLIWLGHRLFLSRYITNVSLSIAVAFVVVQFVASAVIVSALSITRRFAEIRANRTQRVAPRIRQELAAHAAGQDRGLVLARLFRRYPQEFEACLAQFLALVRGNDHQRLCDFAVEMGLVSRWEKRYRARDTAKRKSAVEQLAQVKHAGAFRTLELALADEDELIRIRASVALLRSGGGPEVEKVFAFALTQPLLVRALLAEELRHHLPLLAGRAILKSLTSGRRDQILGTLDLIEAWSRGLSLPLVSTLLRNPDPEIRAKAWRVLPFVGATDGVSESISDAILDCSESVSAAAATTAGRLKLQSAIPALTRRLRGESGTVVLAAARALSQIGSNGLSILESEIVAGTRLSAAAALEALERTRIGRGDW